MGLNITDQVKFLKDNFYLIIILVVLLSPIIWQISEMHFKQEMAGLRTQIESLKMQNEILQNKSDGFKELATETSKIDWSQMESKQTN
jgi:predicted transcriptional regulator